MSLKYILTLALMLSLMSLIAQKSKDIGEQDHHEHHKNEIGTAISPVYIVNEKELSYGLHIHYIHKISETKFGLGIGYERVFDEHKHNTIGIVGTYRLIEELSLNLSPGITFEDSDASNLNFALHIESTYEFEISNFHIGPLLEFAYTPEHYHISLGLHIGYGF